MTRTCSRVALALLCTLSFAVAQRGVPIPQQLTFVPYHADGIYNIGETVGWTVRPGPVDPTYTYKWTVRRNNAVVLKEGKLDLSSGTDKIEVTGTEPEMIYVAVEPVAKLVADAPTAPAADVPAVAPAALQGEGIPMASQAAIRAATTGSTLLARLSRH